LLLTATLADTVLVDSLIVTLDDSLKVTLADSLVVALTDSLKITVSALAISST
ncbi:15548_t:CDS:1, partial [Dentiscutata heterogama]